jgi:hypothetical protein
MSWYNWWGTSSVTDIQTQLQQKIQFLSSGFFQPTSDSSVNSISSNSGVILTPEQLVLGQFLNRLGDVPGPIYDTTASAADLVSFLIKLIDPFPISQGFAWNVAYYNNTGQSISLVGGNGVTIGTSITLFPNKISTLRFYVAESTIGGENIYVSLLGN